MRLGECVGTGGINRNTIVKLIGKNGVNENVLSDFISVNGILRPSFENEKFVRDLNVGASIYINVAGKPVEFIVVQQGIPEYPIGENLTEYNYSDEFNGTWLLMKDIYQFEFWDNDFYDYVYPKMYSDSAMNRMLNDSDGAFALFYYLFDNETWNTIQPVRLSGPYGDTINAKLFLLSIGEINAHKLTDDSWYSGYPLEYFKQANDLIGYFNGEPCSWWTRSISNDGYMATAITSHGISSNEHVTNSFGVRPALILPFDTKLDDDFNLIPGTGTTVLPVACSHAIQYAEYADIFQHIVTCQLCGDSWKEDHISDGAGSCEKCYCAMDN